MPGIVWVIIVLGSLVLGVLVFLLFKFGNRPYPEEKWEEEQEETLPGFD